MATPLTDLLCKDACQWTPTVVVACQPLKQAMVDAPVLCLPDFNIEFAIETDASNVAIGVVPMQVGYPIAYYSKTLGLKLSASSTYIKELYAITQVVHKWRRYLLGRLFFILTDHRSIKELVIHMPDQQVYIRKLLGYHFRIEYNPSCTNLAVDALSRIHESMDVDSDKMVSCLPLISRPSFDFFADIRSENSTLLELLVLH